MNPPKYTRHFRNVNNFTYLEIQIVPKLEDVVNYNYTCPLMQKGCNGVTWFGIIGQPN